MTEVLHTDGSWRLARNKPLNLQTKVCLEHKCPSGGYSHTWAACRFNYFYFNVPCGWCGEVAPKGLQGLFVMLTDDNLRVNPKEHRMRPHP